MLFGPAEAVPLLQGENKSRSFGSAEVRFAQDDELSFGAGDDARTTAGLETGGTFAFAFAISHR